MKYCSLLLFAGSVCGSLRAQATTHTYVPDFNGGSHVDSSSIVSGSSNAERTEVTHSINGRQVPLEKIEERVLREDAKGKSVETVIRKYDPNGQFMSTERVVTDTLKAADGGSTVTSTTYRSDVNGNLQVAQRATTETRKQGSGSSAETVIERPTLNATFQAVEKRSVVTETGNGTSRAQETVYRRSDNGDFQEQLRQVTEEKKGNGQTSTQTAFYEPGPTGAMQLTHQKVATSTKQPDGSEVTEVNLFGRGVPGVAQYSGAPEQLQEQQVIQREKRSDGSVSETLSVRRPTIADPGRLGNLQKVSETVCKGKCGEDPKP